MPKLIALDDGHGIGTPGKRTPKIPELGRSIMENEFNREVVKYLNAELKNNGFKTILTAPTNADTSLGARVATANNAKADLFISIHFNALDGKFDGPGKDPEGFSAHVHSTQYESAKFARIALKHLAGGTPQKNRGLIQQNLYVTRETKMPAVLFELGFMDNIDEARLMLNVNFQKECAREIAKAVCEYYGVKYKSGAPAPKPTTEKKGIGTATVLADQLNFRTGKTLSSPIKKVLKKGEKYFVYAVDGKWVNLGGGWASAGSKGDLLKVDLYPKPKPKPPAPKEDIHRVIVDGKQVGAFGNNENVADVVKDHLDKGAKNIDIEEV